MKVSVVMKRGLPQICSTFGQNSSHESSSLVKALSSDSENSEKEVSKCLYNIAESRFSRMSMASFNQEVIHEILSPLVSLDPCVKPLAGGEDTIKNRLRMFRLVCKKFKLFADPYCCKLFPSDFMHIILSNHNPDELCEYFSLNQSAKEAFEQITRFNESLPSRIYASKVNDLKNVEINGELFKVIEFIEEDDDEEPSCSVSTWIREHAQRHLSDALHVNQRPLIDYFVNSGKACSSSLISMVVVEPAHAHAVSAEFD